MFVYCTGFFGCSLYLIACNYYSNDALLIVFFGRFLVAAIILLPLLFICLKKSIPVIPNCTGSSVCSTVVDGIIFLKEFFVGRRSHTL